MTGFPAVAGDIVFFVTTLTKPNLPCTCRTPRSMRRRSRVVSAIRRRPARKARAPSDRDRRARDRAIYRRPARRVRVRIKVEMLGDQNDYNNGVGRSESGSCPGATCGNWRQLFVWPAARNEGAARCPRCGEILETAPAAAARPPKPVRRPTRRPDCRPCISAIAARWCWAAPSFQSSCCWSLSRAVPEPAPVAASTAAPAQACGYHRRQTAAAPGRPDPGFLDPKTGGAAA